MTHLMGVPVYADEDCRSTTKFRDVPRTWKERLFTRPWRPLRKTRTEGIPVAFVVTEPAMWPLTEPTKKVIAHPEIIEELERSQNQ